MSDTSASQKLRALILSLVMVTSVFAGVVALGGVAAAANESNVTADATPTGQAPAGATNVTVADVRYDPSAGGQNVNNVTIDLGGGADASGFSESTVGNVSIKAFTPNNKVVVQAPYQDNLTVPIPGTLDIKRVVVMANISETAANGTVIDMAHAFNSSTVTSYDTLGTQTVNNQTGFISGKVTTPSNEPVPNTTITVDNGVIQPRTTMTDSSGFYTIEVPPGSYSITAERENFTTASAQGVEVAANSTTTKNLVIRPKVFAVDIDAKPNPGEAPTGSEITFTVTATSNQGNPYKGLQVSASENDPDVTFVGGSTGTTDSNGQVQFTVTSTQPTQTEVTFTAGPGADTNGEKLTDKVTAIFNPRSGNGTIPGEVKAAPDGEPLKDLAGANVWTVRLSQFNENKRFATTDLNNAFGVNDANETVSYRLVRVNGSTGAVKGVVDNDMYRVQIDEPAADVSITKIERLNSSAGVGSGFYVTDRNNDNSTSIAITPLEPGNYTLQVANTKSPEAADFRFAATYSSTQGPAVPNDLTLDAVKERANQSGTASYDVTDAFGEYGLNDLFTSNEIGINYVVIAREVGYSTDFADTFEWSDGYYFDDANKKDIILTLEPEPITPVVNVTNVGFAEGLNSQGGLVDFQEFSNQTDAYSQTIVRDGSFIDVVNVTTTSEETNEPVDSTVTVELDDTRDVDDNDDGPNANMTNFAGSWIKVAGGSIVPGSNDGDSITITTGEDGQAQLWLQADRTTDPLADGDFPESIVATAERNEGNPDETFKQLIGYTQTGSITGEVNRPPNDAIGGAEVYVDQFALNTAGIDTTTPRVDIEPLSTPEPEQYRVSVINSSNDVVESHIVNGSVLESGYSFQEFTDSVRQQYGLIPPTSAGFTLVAETRADGTYTMARVPARGTAAQFENVYTVRAVTNLNNTGQAQAFPGVGSTDDASIVVSGAEAAAFEVTNLQPDGATVQAGATINPTADIQNIGGTTSTVTAEFGLDFDGDNQLDANEVLATNTTEQLVSLESTTVSFNVDTSNVEPGTYTHIVTAGDGKDTATITIEGGSNSPSLSDYTNDQGEVTSDGLSRAIADYVNNVIGSDLLSEVISTYVQP